MDEALKCRRAHPILQETAQLSTIREETFLLYIFFGKWDPYISTTEIYNRIVKRLLVLLFIMVLLEL